MSAADALIKPLVFLRYPVLRFQHPAMWSDESRPDHHLVGLVVIPIAKFDSWKFLIVPDGELRDRVRQILDEECSDRWRCPDPDALLVFAEIQ